MVSSGPAFPRIALGVSKHKFLPLLVLAVGCGIPDSKKLSDLSEDEATQLCESIEPAEFTCDATVSGFEMSYTITLGGDECSTDGLSSDCEATVGDWRDCDAAWRAELEADACSADVPAECDALMACAEVTASI